MTMLKENLKGLIPVDISQSIVENLVKESSTLKLCNVVPMNAPTVTIPKLLGGSKASWVDEASKIASTTMDMDFLTLEAKKMATIIVLSNEALNQPVDDVMTMVKQSIVEAINVQLDQTCLYGAVGTPFDTNIQTSALKNKLVGTGNIVDDVNKGMGLLEVLGHQASDVLTSPVKKKEFRAKSVDNAINGATTGATVFGTPIEFNRNHASATDLIIGDFSKAFVGVYNNLEYMVSEEAVVNGVSLYENDLIALRVVFQVGFKIVEEQAFASITPKA